MTSEVMEISERRRMIRPVQSLEARAALSAHLPSHVGTLLREWRTTRRLSQLELALEANVSSRHLSCVETGKAQPSRDMIARLADALEMPLRERNALLVAAGFAPRYRETELTTPGDGAGPPRDRVHSPAPGAVSGDRHEPALGHAADERRDGADLQPPAPGRAEAPQHAASDLRSGRHAQRDPQLGRVRHRHHPPPAQPGRSRRPRTRERASCSKRSLPIPTCPSAGAFASRDRRRSR